MNENVIYAHSTKIFKFSYNHELLTDYKILNL